MDSESWSSESSLGTGRTGVLSVPEGPAGTAVLHGLQGRDAPSWVRWSWAEMGVGWGSGLRARCRRRPGFGFVCRLPCRGAWNGGVCYTHIRKVLGSPRRFCSSWTNLLLRKRCCAERRDATVRWRGNVGGAGLILRVLWRS